MNKFAFMIHPLDTNDIARKFPIARFFSENILERVIKNIPPFKVSQITGLKSSTGAVAEGFFICCPLTSRQMIELPDEVVINKIVETGLKAQELGADILGLGAFTSVVGDKGLTVNERLDIPVTTGNTYTVATALEGTRLASQMIGIDIDKSNILIIGATGSIGKACTKLLARSNSQLMIAARNHKKLNELANELKQDYNRNVKVTTDINELLPQADIIITVSSSVNTIVDAKILKSGAIVCDIARPRDVGKEIITKRDDILVIDGGIVEIPPSTNFNFNFGFPPGTSYACMAETMILILEKKLESYSLGTELDVNKIIDISKLAKKHGFELSSLRSFERELTLQEINKVRRLISSA